MPVDVFLAAHGGFFRQVEKRAALCRNPERNPFIDPAGYRARLTHFLRELERRLAEQVGDPPTAPPGRRR